MGFQDLTDSSIILKFCSIQSFGSLNEARVTLEIDIFTLSTNEQISLSGCTFCEKGFEVVQVQNSPDPGIRLILTFVHQFWAHRF